LKTPGGASRSDARGRDFGRGKEIQIQIRPGGISRQGGCGVTISEYEKGQVVFAQGDPADSVFYIREGRVKIAVISEQGKEAIVAFLKAGDFIGEGCLTGRPRRVSTAMALQDSVITRVDKVTMVRMLPDADATNFVRSTQAHSGLWCRN
jgi:signal-transduction protein with cAMP-binding, CBS, and nucleotidyltransferase domain